MGLAAEPLYEQDESKDDRRSAQRAARSLAASVAKLHGAVPLPLAAQKLLSITQSNEFRVADVVRTVESDPALTGRLIRDVNASLVGRSRCSSITQAVTLLGSRALRASAVAVSTLELFGREEAPAARTVARHASRSARLARALSPSCGLPPDEMYACAMLLDVGQLMLLRGEDLDYHELLTQGLRTHDLHVAERERYGFDHALLAGHVLAAWNLPHPLPRVVAWHHQPSRAFKAPGQVPKMVALMRLADRLAHVELAATSARLKAELTAMADERAVLGFAEDTVPALADKLAHEAFGGTHPSEPRMSAVSANPTSQTRLSAVPARSASDPRLSVVSVGPPLPAVKAPSSAMLQAVSSPGPESVPLRPVETTRASVEPERAALLPVASAAAAAPAPAVIEGSPPASTTLRLAVTFAAGALVGHWLSGTWAVAGALVVIGLAWGLEHARRSRRDVVR